MIVCVCKSLQIFLIGNDNPKCGVAVEMSLDLSGSRNLGILSRNTIFI